MNGLSRETRLQIMLSEEELAAIDDWRFKQRMPSRAAAIRQLLNIALRVQQKESQGKPMRSQDYGILRMPTMSNEAVNNSGRHPQSIVTTIPMPASAMTPAVAQPR